MMIGNLRGHEAVGKTGRMGGPLAENGKELIGIRALLEWAFAIEKAQLSADDGFTSMAGYGYASSTAAIMRHEQLGCRIDGGGRSDPHSDADLVSAVLRLSVRWSLAVQVAELARACRAPQWDLGPQRIEPVEWSKRNHLGRNGKAEVCRVVEYRMRGRTRRRQDMWVPCRWVPSADQIGAARRGYLAWWGALFDLLCALRGQEFDRFVLTDRMPTMTPWRKSA